MSAEDKKAAAEEPVVCAGTRQWQAGWQAGWTRGRQRAFCWALSGENSKKDAGSACCRWAAPIAPGQRQGGYCAAGLEFKRTSDQRRNYRERGEARARAQHDVLVKSLEKVAGEAVGENSAWKIKLLIFVGGTCGSVHVQTLNNNLRQLGVLESKRNTIRRGVVHELLNAQDTVLCSYFAQRSGARGEGRGRESTVGEAFQGLYYFE